MQPTLTQASLILPAPAALSVADLLQGLDDPQALTVAAFEIPGGMDFTVEAIYEGTPSAENLQRLLAPLIEALQVPPPQIILSVVENRDWVAQSLRDLPPITAGRFFIAGAHGLADAPGNALRLHVEAGQAFGTGHHETTLTCLLALDHLARKHRFTRVLDLGCGTGVLGMAAAKLWRQRITASDIDAVAVAVARENADRNGLNSFLHPVTAAGFAHPDISRAAPFDLIFANILARPLIRLSHAMAQHVTAGGYVILSGLLKTQETAVRSAYRSQGLYLERRFLRGDWSTLLLRKAHLP